MINKPVSAFQPSNLSNEIKKRAPKSRETIPLMVSCGKIFKQAIDIMCANVTYYCTEWLPLASSSVIRMFIDSICNEHFANF
jgi:hypothetical protein